ncbi:TetR/AcrR family transcriptional regulator [Pyxidicoccus xibeiensis]|uniref:TetR/AcrR family transcriptional regulator n=1 Tax=Pyxidicoccus xibeiensis TaxID=2906759 RepID=UPI0020A82485|nr:TetR/AcrR family transcriptional regulator [Pyxidicoccus xibeiensis]MCP3143565.1 TetR/AcrR family transcriptional regulator [Pyxidicoccus xibeiensis]
MPGPQRDAARTRRTLLSTAARVIAEHGAGVSLDLVAREADVSKGGLLHHFPSREALLLGLVEHLVEEFDAAVARALDPADTAPGRFARAWIRSIFEDLSDSKLAHERATLVGILGTVPEVVRRIHEEGERWSQRLAQDGLDAQRVVLITRACDGATMASLFQRQLGTRELTEERDLLLALTRETGPLVDVSTGAPPRRAAPGAKQRTSRGQKS